MSDSLVELLALESAELFREAQPVGRRLPLVLAAPIAYTTACFITPPCAHCWWQATAQFRPDFIHTATPQEAVARARKAAQAGINRILVPAGWLGEQLPEAFFRHVDLIKNTVSAVDSSIEVFATCGHINRASLKTLQAAGLEGYWCGLESPNHSLFQKMRPGDDLPARIRTLEDAAEIGLKIWSGFLFGVGEDENDILRGLDWLSRFKLDSFSLTPYKQYPYIDFERRPSANLFEWARINAVIRLYWPDINLFGSVEQAHWALRAGINAFLPVDLKKSVSATRAALTRLQLSIREGSPAVKAPLENPVGPLVGRTC